MNSKAGGTVLTARRTPPATETGPATSHSQPTGLPALPLAGASLLVALLVAGLYELGLISVMLSAALTAVPVLVASVLYLGFLPRRLPASVLGLALAAAPSLVLATALLSLAAQVGLPIAVVTTRLAAVGGWWLALAVLRPLVDRIGSAQMPARHAWLIFSPAVVVLGMCAYAWRGASTPQRFAFLFQREDNATWVSHAYSLLRHGHLPRNILESEYFGYSSLSSMPGVIADVALHGRPSTHAATAYAAIDVTLANQLLSIAVAGAVLATGLLAALVLVNREERPPALGITLLSLVITGVGASVVAGTPLLLAGHLSLAWADLALVLMALLVVAAIRATGWRAFPPSAAACLAAYVAAGSWVYVVITPITFGILLITVRRSGLREKGDGTSIGHGPQVVCLSIGLIVAGLVAAVPQFVAALQLVGLKGLSGAVGGVAPVEPTTLAGAILVGVAVTYVAYRWSDSLSLVVTLLMAASSTSAILVFLTGVLPGNNPTYALTKSLYVVVVISTLAVIALVAQASRTRHHRVLVIGSLVLASLITTSPTFGSLIKWPTAVTAPDAGPARRILELAASAQVDHTVACRPSPHIEQLDNYLCNRWAESLAPRQGTADFRLAVLAEPGPAPKAWAKYLANGFLERATVDDASRLMTGRCVPADELTDTTPTRFPDLDVRVRSFQLAHPLALQGHVDDVSQCGRTVIVVGWAPFTERRASLDVWAGGPVEVVRAVRRERVDVVSRPGNGGLRSPGYLLVLKMKPSQMQHICISLDGRRGTMLDGARPDGCAGPS